MSAWRQKAIDALPESKKDFEDPNESIYLVFSTMLTAAIQFHKVGDSIRLRKIYGFAEWCFRQKSKDLWNAAGTAFYEHLGDRPETLQEMNLWVKRETFLEIRELIGLRVGRKELQHLDDAYGITAGK
jgi:hypothetical protein